MSKTNDSVTGSGDVRAGGPAHGAGYQNGADFEEQVTAAVLATVAYSDVFDMPVADGDVRRFLVGVRAEPADVEMASAKLIANGALERRDELLYLAGRQEVLDIHAARTARAERMWPQAHRWTRVIAALPFVRMVAVTGGLACDSVEDHDDIDLFIVTAPRRLWLTRLVLVGLVRVVGLRGPELCPNFMVTTDALSLDVRTQYVARELAQSVPLAGQPVWSELLQCNDWYRDLLPNAEPIQVAEIGSARPGLVRRAMEAVLGLGVFDRLEAWEMRRKIQRLTAVSSRRPEVGTPDESSFSPDVCKGHMEGNAAGIEEAWRDRIQRWGARSA